MLSRAPRSHHVVLLLAILWLLPLVTPVQAQPAQVPAHTVTQDIETAAGQPLRLADSAEAAPATYGSYRRFGLYDAAPISFSSLFTQVRVRFAQTLPADSAALVAVRAYGQSGRWSEWQSDVASGALVRFGGQMRAVQYRVVLLSNSAASPTLGPLTFEPSSGVTARAESGDTVAPTYRLRVTRQGMVGGRTANGHIIEPNDFFVSLPSGRALSSRGGDEYLVRLSANGRSIVVPVWDNGPWNHHDDFWNKNRETYRDLPAGWPQDHAAYYENHNGGVAERGRVRYPSAVDIGDGAYWALGLDGAQATVNVSFLWLGADPGAGAQPLNLRPSDRPSGLPARAPAAPTATPATPSATPSATPEPTPTAAPRPSVEVNDGDPTFTAEGNDWGVAASCGYGGQARSAPTVLRDDAVSNQAIWRPALQGGTYEVFAFVPGCGAAGSMVQSARYIIHHAQGDAFVVRDQAAAPGTWVSLGRYSFAAGTDSYVQLRNVASADERTLWVDAVKWVPTQP